MRAIGMFRYLQSTKNSKFLYHSEKSMISNIQACKRMHNLLTMYDSIDKFMIPRTYAITSRRLSHLCLNISPNYMNAESRMSMKKFIEHLLKINLNLLSPDECNNILYFLRISENYSKDLGIEHKQIIQFVDKLTIRIMKNINLVSFNKLCDFHQELVKHRVVFNVDRIKDELLILEACFNKFPSEKIDKQIDSIFHFTLLYMNLLRMDSSIRPKKLFELTSLRIRKLCKYLLFTLKIKIVDISISTFSQTIKDKQLSQITKQTMCTILKQICNDLDSMLDPKYKAASEQFKKLITEINSKNLDAEQVKIKLAKTVNSIKKVDKTEKQIEKQRKKQLAELQEFENDNDEQQDYETEDQQKQK